MNKAGSWSINCYFCGTELQESDLICPIDFEKEIAEDTKQNIKESLKGIGLCASCYWEHKQNNKSSVEEI